MLYTFIKLVSIWDFDFSYSVILFCHARDNVWE